LQLNCRYELKTWSYVLPRLCACQAPCWFDMTRNRRIQILGKSEYSINPGKPPSNPFIDSSSIHKNFQSPILKRFPPGERMWYRKELRRLEKE
jgi:hypothetical protein